MAQFLKQDTTTVIDTSPTHFHGLKRLDDGTLVYVRADFYTGNDGVNLGGTDEMIPVILEFAGDGNITEFDIDFFADNPADIEVWVGPNKLDPLNDYTISNDKVTITPAPNDKVFVLFVQEDITVQSQPSEQGTFELRNNLNRELVNIASIFDQYKLDTRDLYYYINNDGELVARRALTDVVRDPIDIL